MRAISFLSALLVSGILPVSAQTSSPDSADASRIPQFTFQLSDPVTLPIGAPGSFVSAVFGCASGNSVFVQVITPPAPGTSQKGNVALYAVRSPEDIVQFHSELAPGYRLISPIVRYFATDSRVVGLAYGLGIDYGDVKVGPDSKHPATVLLQFDRKGTLLSAKALDPGLHPDQVAAFASGEVLLAAWDHINKLTFSCLIPRGQWSTKFRLPTTIPPYRTRSHRSRIWKYLLTGRTFF